MEYLAFRAVRPSTRPSKNIDVQAVGVRSHGGLQQLGVGVAPLDQSRETCPLRLARAGAEYQAIKLSGGKGNILVGITASSATCVDAPFALVLPVTRFGPNDLVYDPVLIHAAVSSSH